jgi:UDP-N-acetylmuramate dehydrogenase
MPTPEETRLRLAEIPNLTVFTGTPLSRYTRFGIGGPADLYAETGSAEAFVAALSAARANGMEIVVIGGGTDDFRDQFPRVLCS